MPLKLTGKNRQNLIIMLIVDGLAFLTALFYQFQHTSISAGARQTYVPLHQGARAAWILFGVMIVLTAIFLLMCREENVIRGLPPEESEPKDEDKPKE
ncbi:MAG: hypothetical protein NTX50_07060 [Candidatus Sumerlaeota bacterium]|nr:hypothetical protein [Candidatus Sumerlaeota bacterium]